MSEQPHGSGTFGLEEIRARQAEGDHPYLEFMRSSELSAGLYALPAGCVDPQQPHSEDELYYVVQGSAVLRVGDAEHRVEAGSVAFVGTGIEHRFHTITEDLAILVVFAPPQRSRSLASS